MAKYNNISELFTAIAAAIRGKAGTTDVIPAQNFPEQVAALAELGPVATLEFSTDDTTQSSQTVTLTNNVLDYDYLAFVMYDPLCDVSDIFICSTSNYAKKSGTYANWFHLGNTYKTTGSSLNPKGMTGRRIYRRYNTQTKVITIDQVEGVGAYISNVNTYNIVKKIYGIKGDMLNIGG